MVRIRDNDGGDASERIEFGAVWGGQSDGVDNGKLVSCCEGSGKEICLDGWIVSIPDGKGSGDTAKFHHVNIL